MFGNLGVSACGGNLKYYLLHIIEHCNMTWEESCANSSADIQIAEDGCLLLAIIRKGHSRETENYKITRILWQYSRCPNVGWGYGWILDIKLSKN